MMFPEPGRLSTTICWPTARERRSVTKRQMMSGAEPGANETMTRIGRAGQFCAPVSPKAQHKATSDNARARFFMILTPPPPFSPSSEFHDLLRKLVQLLRDARVADQEIVAAPAVGALGDVGRVAHHVHVLLDRHGFVVADQRPLDHVVALPVRVQSLFLGALVLPHEGVVLGEDLAALRAGLHPG